MPMPTNATSPWTATAVVGPPTWPATGHDDARAESVPNVAARTSIQAALGVSRTEPLGSVGRPQRRGHDAGVLRGQGCDADAATVLLVDPPREPFVVRGG